MSRGGYHVHNDGKTGGLNKMQQKGISVIAIAVLFILGVGTLFFFGPQLASIMPGAPITGEVLVGDCPTDKSHTLTLLSANKLSTTGETFDVNLIGISNKGHVVNITDTTEGTVGLNCGERYTFKSASTGTAALGQDADNSKVLEAISENIVVNPDGSFTFSALTRLDRVEFKLSQHALPEARIYHLSNNTYLLNSTTDITNPGAGSYAAGNTAEIFQGTPNATTGVVSAAPINIGTDEQLELRMDIRAQGGTDVDFNDFGWWLLVDWPSATVYGTPSLKIEGVTQTSNCATMNTEESSSFSGTDFCYKLDLPIQRANPTSLSWIFITASGQNPGAADDINITMAAIGNYVTTLGGTTVKQGAIRDDSARTSVYTQGEWQLDIQ